MSVQLGQGSPWSHSEQARLLLSPDLTAQGTLAPSETDTALQPSFPVLCRLRGSPSREADRTFPFRGEQVGTPRGCCLSGHSAGLPSSDRSRHLLLAPSALKRWATLQMLSGFTLESSDVSKSFTNSNIFTHKKKHSFERPLCDIPVRCKLDFMREGKVNCF